MAASAKYRGTIGVVWPMIGPVQMLIRPRMTRKNVAASSAPPRPIQSRATTSAKPDASAIIAGSKTMRNCGTPKSNSAW